MKIVSIGILRYGRDVEEPVMLTQACDLSSLGFFQRSGVRGLLTFFSQMLVKRTEPGTRQTVKHNEFDYNVHTYVRADGLAGTVTADMEYPARVAFLLLTQVLDQYANDLSDVWPSEVRNEVISYPPLGEYLVKYQDPAEADKITKIQRDLDQTTDILYKTIDNVLARGEKLDDLVERSDDLSRQSKLFYSQAKRANSCCLIL
mmetsp:Transcript_12707/g.16693  ORF Transcript_12707/g.16693 Transcript_12707/m.16693 type:complete len:203 (+) Transcript_12707:120-728(+)|eukprot:CAMPEP_0117760680 /NCGR_PEP_ID=MMETSP0947-20121206/16784_1 /TAXON_ID=44440 /ORGANISM="Chattonella subsalsa, Strain CCMP2191" /LENGTH=202 /DNA_ID=CAMNT_0005581437 /DNA_START=107 /DNA_END=715 /DNA_ORIENTATION=+